MVGVNPEVAHEHMSGLNFMHARGPGLGRGQALPHRPERPGIRAATTRTCASARTRSRAAFFLVKFLEDVKLPRHRATSTAHAYRTEDFEGVKDFARGSMRSYLIYKEKAPPVERGPGDPGRSLREISPTSPTAACRRSAPTARPTAEALKGHTLRPRRRSAPAASATSGSTSSRSKCCSASDRKERAHVPKRSSHRPIHRAGCRRRGPRGGPLGGAVAPLNAQQPVWRVNDREYLEQRGAQRASSSAASTTACSSTRRRPGIELIHHGVRTATGGAVRLKPDARAVGPDPEARRSGRSTRQTGTIEVTLRYEDFDFDSRAGRDARRQGGSASRVVLDKPVPERLAGPRGPEPRVPAVALTSSSTYLADGRPGIFPRYPSGPTQAQAGGTQIRQFEGHSTFDDRGRERVRRGPSRSRPGKTLVLAPEDPERRVTIRARRATCSCSTAATSRRTAGSSCARCSTRRPTGKVVEWSVRRSTIAELDARARWSASRRPGYHPVAEEGGGHRARRERHAAAPRRRCSRSRPTASRSSGCRRRSSPGASTCATATRRPTSRAVDKPGLYFIQYGEQKTPASSRSRRRRVRTTWQPTLGRLVPRADGPHVRQRGLPGLARRRAPGRRAPGAGRTIQHFDGYRMGPTTETPLRSRASASPASTSAAGSTPATSTSARSPRPRRCMQPGRHLGARSGRRARRDARRPGRRGYVDLHRPDGKPDLLQQIEHGALRLVAQHRAFGRGDPRPSSTPQLHQLPPPRRLVDADRQPDLRPGR
ncbi:MAG: hypothetical protein MZV63_16005 [Marinilabiliales bacterium]|nr:hypothetical protein [Marinilabiliales bacterium]